MVDKPTLSMALLDALAAWSNVEVQMAMLFGVISGIQNVRENLINPKPHAIFDAVISFDARRAVLNALMADESVTPLDHEIWNRCSARLQKLYKKRHELAHFTISSGPINPLDPQEKWNHQLMPFFTLGAMMRRTAKVLPFDQIQARTGQFEEAAHAVIYFADEAAKRRGKPQDNPTQEPPLVARLRELSSQILAEREQRPQSSRQKYETED